MKFIEKIKEQYKAKAAEGKSPLFWLIYGVATFIGVLVVVLCMVKFHNYLEAYEKTRPVHEADKVVENYFKVENRELLKSVLTNKVDNGIETMDEILDAFYDSINGQELTYGRFFGQYSDEKPRYIVTAGDKQVAYFTLKETKKYSFFYKFKLWEVESVSLTAQAQYSYAVTIPDTMTLFVNGTEIPKSDVKNHKDTDCPVGYDEYSDAGFYSEPIIKVVDRAGQEVKLSRDQATGGYYYLIHYAYAPADTEVSFGSVSLTEKEILKKDIAPEVSFFMVQEVIKRYPEYQSLATDITYPTFVRYYVDVYTPLEGITWKNRLGTESSVVYDEKTQTFSSSIVSDDTHKEELTELATSFLKTYSLFCTRDKKYTDLQSFFPEASEYLEKISHLNNSGVDSHSDVDFREIEVKEYTGYSPNLVYVHISIEQVMKMRSDGKWLTYPVDLPLWLVNISDKWYVGGLDYASFVGGFTGADN